MTFVPCVLACSFRAPAKTSPASQSDTVLWSALQGEHCPASLLVSVDFILRAVYGPESSTTSFVGGHALRRIFSSPDSISSTQFAFPLSVLFGTKSVSSALYKELMTDNSLPFTCDSLIFRWLLSSLSSGPKWPPDNHEHVVALISPRSFKTVTKNSSPALPSTITCNCDSSYLAPLFTFASHRTRNSTVSP